MQIPLSCFTFTLHLCSPDAKLTHHRNFPCLTTSNLINLLVLSVVVRGVYDPVCSEDSTQKFGLILSILVTNFIGFRIE
ncbi:uncharacterized protein DS421_20g699900 [Arachis hypogaea]|nr:uncharacterized protein DS421_20g699900 [Arachis hypogaea]